MKEREGRICCSWEGCWRAIRHMEACRSVGKHLLDALEDAIEDAEQKQKIQ
jgi:hypothetical protein